MSNLTSIFKNIFTSLMLVVVAFGLFTSINGLAVTNPGKPDICQNGQNQNCNAGGGFLNVSTITSFKDVANLAASIANILTFVILSIAVIFIVYGAFIWLTQEKDGADRGRKIIFNAVVAMVIAVLAFGLTQAIINILYTSNSNGI